jgi:C_GCAxxG_C_C family probable redox protein
MSLRKEEITNRAVEHLLAGYNCAQTTLLCCQEMLSQFNDEVLKAATGFGGGIGNLSDVCGGVSGGVMGISQKFGRIGLSEKEAQQKEKTYLLSAEYLTRFREVQESVYCRDLLAVDISNQATRKEYWTPDNRKKCAEGPVALGLKILYGIFEREGVLP